MIRERRLANELVNRFGLQPPIDLVTLVEHYADLEQDDIPASCDGLVVGLHGPRERPLIILDKTRHELRKRFTLAHELGHVLLPWHIGSNVACDTDRPFYDVDAHHAANAEREANRFAGELLVPSQWLNDRMADLGTDRMGPLLDAINEARVSAHVACLRLREALPPGHVFAIVDHAGVVALSGQTDGTGIQPPARGKHLERKRLDRFAVTADEHSYGTRRVIWWSYVGNQPAEVSRDDCSAREVLDGLLSTHSESPSEQARIQRVLAGTIGAANSEARREGSTDTESLYVRFRSRFAKERDLPESLLDDSEFETWLWKRAAELSGRARPSV